MRKRTLKEDRELAIRLAENLGHEMNPWGWWFGQRRGIASCKLCNDWIGLTSLRNWEYDPDFNYSTGITGTAIEEDSHWRTSKCFGVAYRAKERSRWTKHFNKILSVIKNNSADKAAKVLCGDKP